MSIPITDRNAQYGVTTSYEDVGGIAISNLPQHIALISQGNTSATFTEGKTSNIISAAQVAAIAGFGSPAHLQALELFPEDGRTGIGGIPCDLFLMDGASGAVSAVYTLAVGGTTQTTDQAYRVLVGGVPTAQFTITATTTAAAAASQIETAVNAVVNMPAVALAATADVGFTFKAAGEIGNNMDITVEGDIDGLTFTVTQATQGATNPDITDSLDLIAETWYTLLVVGTAPYTDTTTLAAIASFVEGRWGATTKKPCVSIFGTDDDFSTRSAVTDVAARKLERSASLRPAMGSKSLWHIIGARDAALIAITANQTPAQNYKSLMTGIDPGDDTDQETTSVRSNSFRLGSGTSVLYNGVVQQKDTITMYHPDGDTNPAYQYVVDIMKLANIIYGLDQVIGNPDLEGLPLLADSADVTAQVDFLRPRDVVSLLQSLADIQTSQQLLLADAQYTKDNITVIVNPSNAKRLDIVYPVRISGNAEIFDVSLKFAFYFGQ